ncbi:MAG: hypothetical protein KIT58_04495 [Planctomycetota bacterium]|nr:hypothetical protein [Planctomycetota bacterium]
MIPGAVSAVSGVPGVPISLAYKPPREVVEVVAERVGPGTDEATRERALRVALVGVELVAGVYRKETIPESKLPEAWLAAAPGSQEREKLRARAAEVARVRAGGNPWAVLCDLLSHQEPGRCAGAAVACGAREAQAVADYFVPNLIRALDAAGFHVVRDL